ncbi:cytosolic endo-beta-N-acetylglucosaminidase-like isoform X2 [Hydractinia symbiolongicarpus]|uniref:cytosolic endo-beta-N-acetylglucosaminidase-like isoform X2 n=1 Tax=Hydractinia symbiolongicarpus TaxID=13093 RepID=UPI00254DC05B|nr:cytosolic endo-beta-N-acetylglucosaminidase-like isoform X2 [Hydractinia symbiolongicarpus]
MAEVVVILLTVAFGLLVIYIVSVLSRKPRRVISHRELLNTRQKYFADQSSKQKKGAAIIPQENVESDDLKVKIISKNETNESNKHCSAVVDISSSLLKDVHIASQPVIEPISSLEKLLTWIPGYEEFAVARISIRSVQNDGKPKTLVCHDMKGGYLEDRFCQGYQSDKCYHLHYWNLIDTFCYFSHNFITIPPPCWTNAAHIHGVKSLGTVITEWNEGAVICEEMLESEKQIKRSVDQLVRIAEYYQFDGWLVNIENEIKPDRVQNVVLFLKMLTESMHQAIKGSEVIWYDSVINTGQLKWQNKLCSVNRIFFDVCDGIFLNYNWSIHDLQESLYLSGAERQLDVYVGVDVFGRGCFGGGGWNTYKALPVIRDKRLSAAIFAPGWVMEKFGEDEFPKNNQKFWEVLSSYLYPHYVSSLPVVSSFCRGYGTYVFRDGMKLSSKPWTNLSAQSLQPTFSSSFYQLGPKSGMSIESLNYCTSDGFNGGGCIEINGFVSPKEEQTRTVFRLYKAAITLQPDEEYFVSYTFKTSSPHMQVFLLLICKNHPIYIVFTPKKENVIKYSNDSYTVPEDQNDNYTFVEQSRCSEVSKEDIDQWNTRDFTFRVEQLRDLQEIRLACTTGGHSEEIEKHAFAVRFGELRVEKSCKRNASIPPPVNPRCRNVNVFSKGAVKCISFTLSWDYKLKTNETAPKCYDIFCKGMCGHENILISEKDDQSVSMKSGEQFIGRAYTVAYYVTDLFVPEVCEEGLVFTVQSIGDNDNRLPLDLCPNVCLKW